MKFKNFIKIFFAILFVFVSTNSYAKTIKWSMQGDSLTLDPHAKMKVLLLKFQDKFMRRL